MKKIVIFLFCVFASLYFAEAQEVTKEEKERKNKSDILLSAAVKNRHLWRCGVGINGFSVQGTLQYSYAFFRIGGWGAHELTANAYSEFDVYFEADFLQYFTLGVYDFYFPKHYGGRIKKDYSKLRTSPNHALDVFLKYSGTKSIPLGALVGTYVLGGADQDENGKQKFSTYLELNYTFKVKEKGDIKCYIGATTDNESAYAAKKITGYDSSGSPIVTRPATESEFNIIGFGAKYTRSFQIGKFPSALSGEILYNPNAETVYLALAASIDF